MESMLYGGKVKMTLDGRHQYWAEIDGGEKQKSIGVTSVSGLMDKPQLIYWAVNLACEHIKTALASGELTPATIEEARGLHTKKMKDAQTSGTAVHEFAELYVKSMISGGAVPEIPKDEKVLNGALAFMRWVDEHKVKFVSAERLVYSRAHGFGGTMDAEAIIDGKLRVIDYKTSKSKKPGKGKEKDACGICGKVGCGGVYVEHRFQTAAYQLAAEEESSKYEGDRMIVRFDKETGDFSVHEVGNFNEDAYAFLGLLAAKKRLNEM